jgi:hypothetical protein
MTLFAVILAVMSFMTIFFGFNAVKANPEEVSITEATVNIVNGAEIKTKGNSGIRFIASVSAKDFSGLKAKYGKVEYGVIIAPTDFVKSEETFKIGGWQYAENDNVTEYVEGSNVSGKLYQRATVVPVLKGGEYVFKGAFVNIAEENYDRDFSVRAYACVKVEDEDGSSVDYFAYSDVVTRSVFTVANGVLANGSMAGDTDGLTYVKNVEKAVYDKYTTRSVTYENLTEGKEKSYKPVAGDTISFVTTLSDGTKTLTAKPIISKYGDYMTENVDADGNFDGTYTVNKSEDFGVLATMCSYYPSYITNGADNPTILVDCEQTTLEVEDITLENSAVGEKWEGFFTKKGNGSISKISQAIENDAISAAALDTCPTGEDVYVINNPAYSNDAVYLGAGMQDKLLNKYVSFKFYNFGYNYLKHSFSLNGMYCYFGSNDALISNGNTGRYMRSVYDCYGNDIGLTGVTEYNVYQGTWCTMEISMLQWFNVVTSGIALHADALSVSGTYQNVFISDVKVSNVPLSETYSDLEVRVEDKNGGNIQPGDELAFSAYAKPFGEDEKVKVDALITTTSGAMDGNIYQGIGNFTVTAKAFGMTATKDVVAEVTRFGLSNLTISAATEGNVSLEKIEVNIPTGNGAPSGLEVFKATFTSYGDKNVINFDKSLLFNGCYLTYKYYIGKGQKLGLEGNYYVHSTIKTGIYDNSSAAYCGGPIVKHVAYDGEYITADNIKSYEGTWATIEINYTQSASNAHAKVFLNASQPGNGILYLTDITVTSYSRLNVK